MTDAAAAPALPLMDTSNSLQSLSLYAKWGTMTVWIIQSKDLPAHLRLIEYLNDWLPPYLRGSVHYACCSFFVLYVSFMCVCLCARNDELTALKEPISVRVWHISACLDEGLSWIITRHSKIRRRRKSAPQLYFLQCPTRFDTTASYSVLKGELRSI